MTTTTPSESLGLSDEWVEPDDETVDTSPGKPSRVLVVDDDPTAALLLAAILESLALEVNMVGTGRDAIEAVAKNEPDLVLLDLGLPDMSGLDVARSIRARHPQTRLPIVFVSGEQNPVQRVKGFDAGGSDFVTKPYDVSEIKSRITHQLENLVLRRQLEGLTEVLEHRVEERTAQLKLLADLDPVTGRFNERGLAGSLHSWRREHADRLLLAVEIAQWETFTSWLGHSEAGAILRAFAERLETIPGSGPIGRFGASVFVVALEGSSEDGDLLEALRRQLQEPLTVGARVIQIKVAMGAVVDTVLAKPESALLQDVSLGLVGAKRKAQPFGLLTEERRAELSDEVSLEQDLWVPELSNQLSLDYQPLFDVTGSLRSYEALVRWVHPRRGMILPGVFIPVAERSGSIAKIGWWTIGEAIRQLASWRMDHVVDQTVRIAVNLSSVQASDPTLPGRVEEHLQSSGLPARCLELELTETAILDESDPVRRVLDELRALGVTIALDDFGTGASSLQLLQQMPADVVKIDRSFVARMGAQKKSRAIVAATIQLAHELGKEVVAEGVEEAAEFELLKTMECDLFQGYLFSRPLDAAGVASLMALRAAGPESQFS